MSLRTPGTDFDARISLPTPVSSDAFTFIVNVCQKTDPNAAKPVLMAFDGSGQIYGLQTTSDGQTLRFAGSGGFDPTSAAGGSLVVNTIKTIAIVGSSGNTWTAYVDGVAGTPRVPAQTRFDISLFLFGSDFDGGMDAEYGYFTALNFAATGSQIAAARNTATPWALFAANTVVARGSLVGADLAQVGATVLPVTVGFNPDGSARSANDPTFGVALTGSTVLPII